jgi:hypothetical protein
MVVFKSNQKRANPYAAYTDEAGTKYTRIPAELLEEIAEPAAPGDYSDDTYYRTEQDDAPYVIYTRKSDEQINEAHNTKVWQQIDAVEKQNLLPRVLREFLLEQPGADQKPWFAKIKQVDDEITALKGTLNV